MAAADIRDLARLCRQGTLQRLEANLVVWADEGRAAALDQVASLAQPPFAIRRAPPRSNSLPALSRSSFSFTHVMLPSP